MNLAVAKTLCLVERCSDTEELYQTHVLQEQKPVNQSFALCNSPVSGNRPRKSVVWSNMIREYSRSNQPEQSLLVYHQMLCHSVPHSAHTFPSLLKACSSLSALEETRQLHAHIIKFGFESDIYNSNSLLHNYASLGRMESACFIFDRIRKRDIISWNSMINGYIKYGNLDMAQELFKDMPQRNVISWTVLISGFVGASMNKEALKLFYEMQMAGMKPDNVALTSILSACANLGAFDQGRLIHSYIEKNEIQVDSYLGCALIDMYANCGEMEEALKVFSKSKKKNTSMWTAIISCLSIHGEGKEALDFFMQMTRAGIKPNSFTFTAILMACSYAGLVDEGKSLFKSMERVYGLKPTIEHYGCMVNLLGRAGLLKEAEEFIETMHIKPNAVIYGALMNACQIHGNCDLGKRIGKLLIGIDPGHSGRYIHLAKIYAAAREWERAAEVRKEMKEQGIWKPPGKSAISIKGIVHEFSAGDTSHPQSKDVCQMWDKIAERLRIEGYKAAVGNLLLDLEDDQKETAIHQHSEKLAVAFGLISTKPVTRIRIVKNLRVCEDCHTVMKLISKVYAREIVMRDRIRFHVFRNGKCTCGDYW